MNKLLGEAELVLPAETSSRTLASELFGRLRADIVECKLAPGERLRLPELSERYESGISPLREALVRLSTTGLVVLEEQKGFRVAPVSREDLVDLNDVRNEVECMALARSIKNGDVEWEARVVSAHHKLSRLVPISARNSQELAKDWEQAHQDFHLALVSACNSRWLLHFRNLLAQQTARYRRLIVTIGIGGRDVGSEHAVIADAALARDAERACALISAHFSRTTETVLSANGTQPAQKGRQRNAKRPTRKSGRRQ